MTRCLAIVIFALFPLQKYVVWFNIIFYFVYTSETKFLFSSGSSNNLLRTANDEYHSSLRELSMLLANKKFVEVKPLIVQSIGILKENPVPNLKDVPHLVCRLIRLFYTCNFLATLPEVWQLDFQFNS